MPEQAPIVGPHAPRVIADKYQLVRELGSGGMGTVYEAEHTWTGRRVALKVLRPEYSQDQVAAQRFLQEARSATVIAHPNIVEVLDMGRDPTDGSLYLAQELMRGLDLRDHLTKVGRMSLADALDVMVPVMGALVAAEQRGIVHRDIKPENIFLGQNASGAIEPKLIDFGISKILEPGRAVSGAPAAARALTHAGAPIGTPQYMSPEQLRADVTLDCRCDVWAVGVVLWEMLAGRCPYDAPSHHVLAAQVLTEDAPRIEQHAPSIPAAFAKVLHGALVRDREGRHQTMRAFLTELLRFADEHTDMRINALRAQHAESLRALAAPPGTPQPYAVHAPNAMLAAPPPPAGAAGAALASPVPARFAQPQPAPPAAKTPRAMTPREAARRGRRIGIAAAGGVLLLAAVASAVTLASRPSRVEAPAPRPPSAQQQPPQQQAPSQQQPQAPQGPQPVDRAAVQAQQQPPQQAAQAPVQAPAPQGQQPGDVNAGRPAQPQGPGVRRSPQRGHGGQRAPHDPLRPIVSWPGQR